MPVTGGIDSEVSLLKPINPGVSIFIDQTEGDDSQTGFDFANPIQTLNRLIEVLSSYNWNGNNCQVYFYNFAITSSTQLSFGQVTNLGDLAFNGQNTADLSSSVIIINFNNINRFTWGAWICTSGGRIATRNGNEFSFNNCDLQASAAGVPICDIESTERFNAVNVKATNGAVSVKHLCRVKNCQKVTLAPNNQISDVTFLDSLGQFDFTTYISVEGSTTNFTGKPISILSPNSSLINASRLSGTVASSYPNSTVILED